MNKKLTVLLAASLLLTATSCQSGSINKPSAAQPPSSSNPPANGTAASNPSDSAEREKTGEPAEVKPGMDQTIPAQIPADSKAPVTQDTSPSPETKRYKMNPKTYDIIPVDPNVTDKKVVLLTFDDGPRNKEVLESILNTLDKHKAKAIFFVNGYLVKQKPELLKLIHERGQTIGNHSWDHIDLKKEGRDKINRQIGDVQQIVKELTGAAPQFFRPPFGSGSDEVRAKVKEENMLYMTWSNGSLDWEMTTRNNDPDKVISNVMEQLRSGSNILMHELPWTDKALDKLLTQLKEKQYGFVDPGLIEITP